MGWKKKEERALCSKIELVLTQRMKKGNRNSHKKTRSWRGEEKSVRTSFHVRHFPNLPGGNVGIKISLLIKEP